MTSHPPIVLDIDGTLTRPESPSIEPEDSQGLDPRVMDPLREWPAPVVFATGKAFPYPVGLCSYVGVPERVVAENGGVVLADDVHRVTGDPSAIERAASRLRDEVGLGWGDADTINRWRETELAVRRDRPIDRVREIASAEGLEVVDSGYAYHVKSPDVTKGRGLQAVADVLDCPPESFVAVGDAVNDVPLFETVGYAVAVANADEAAKAAADRVSPESAAAAVREVLTAIERGELGVPSV